jgi:hypothetical protein
VGVNFVIFMYENKEGGGGVRFENSVCMKVL